MARKKEVTHVPATEPAVKAVRLELDPDMHRQLRIEAAKLDKSMAAVVRDLIQEFLAKRPKGTK
jgi:plasmid stability protein